MPKKMMKKILKFTILLICLIFLLGIMSFFIPSRELTTQELFIYHIANPIPTSVSDLECTYYFDPTLGDGGFEIRFQIEPSDLKIIISELDKNKLDIDFFLSLENNDYAKAFIDFLGQDISKLTYKYDKISYINIYTNKKMNKVIAIHHGFMNNNPIINMLNMIESF